MAGRSHPWPFKPRSNNTSGFDLTSKSYWTWSVCSTKTHQKIDAGPEPLSRPLTLTTTIQNNAL